MSIKQEKRWITGEEFGRERRRLIAEGAGEDDPRLRELYRRVTERDDYLFDRYGRRYLTTDRGKWIAVSLDGEVIIRETAAELGEAARDRFGAGNYSKRKLSEFPGYHARA